MKLSQDVEDLCNTIRNAANQNRISDLHENLINCVSGENERTVDSIIALMSALSVPLMALCANNLALRQTLLNAMCALMVEAVEQRLKEAGIFNPEARDLAEYEFSSTRH